MSPLSPDTQVFAQRIKPPTNSSSKNAAMARQSLVVDAPVLQTPSVQPFVTPAVPENTLPADSGSSNQRAAKRRRASSNSSEIDFAWSWPMSPSISSSESLSVPSPQQPIPSVGSTVKIAFSPLIGYGAQQDCVSPHTRSRLLQHQAPSDVTRLSVSSLLSVPFDSSTADSGPSVYSVGQCDGALSSGDAGSSFDYHRHHHHHHHSSSCYYGIDAGFWDLDLEKNNDANALSGVWRNTERGKGNIHEQMAEATNHSCGYYTKPVSVRIPRALGTLPPKLTENPMNMLYFHHFINNTAHLLVPHDDPQSNPFRTILPQMAINNDNLLSLLLAYSASHRARILGQKEPVMRIALWVQDIFPALRRSLDDHKQKISNANVATAIMLSSLAIVSPTAFGYNIPWQRHLMLARELIAARPEGLRVDHHSSLEGQMCSFLWSWFAYIDVLGGLSGGPTDATPAWILDYKVYNPQDDDENDCIMGFTTRCVYILSQIAELVRRHEPDRLRATRKDANAWKPSMHIIMSVESLEDDVRDSMAQPPRPCAHLLRSGDAVRWKEDEIVATNEAYHWAALVNLQRRVLGKPSEHPDVQGLVQEIINCIDRVSVGGTAENCLLLPLFTAGCDCIDPERRKTLLRRMLSLEGSGMMQVTRARALMQRSWETGKPWETLLTTEFIG
ncbi:hypothetical protein SEPCBS57363_000198 [Sporothrix epigloea]|uniref:C6 zinc finger domain containing protein n=1 Tax=Sporothrix epigloea TaxID=1892477 RepID=A0ABP0D3E6_9PEZI